MYERVLFRVIQEGIDLLVAKPDALRTLIDVPGWEAPEVDALLSLWSDAEKRPQVVHGYARIGGRFPSYNIVLSGEGQDQQYIGQSLGFEDHLDEAKALVDRVEKALGRQVKCGVERWKFDYSIFVYAEHPEVCLSCYNVLRSIFIGSQKKLLEEGAEMPAETPAFSGMDLAPDPRYQPENLFARQFNVSVYGHILFTREMGLGPWALGRGKRIAGLFVNNNVTGVDARINPR